MESAFQHRNIRLPIQDYLGKKTYFITICCADRRKIFTSPENCSDLLRLLDKESALRLFAIPAYCLMPDHLHFLACGLTATSNFLAFMKSFRIKSSRQYMRVTGGQLWQKKFYDHVLRSEESLDSVAWYIWMNPVRAGLSKDIGEFPFAGSYTIRDPFRLKPEKGWKPEWKG